MRHELNASRPRNRAGDKDNEVLDENGVQETRTLTMYQPRSGLPESMNMILFQPYQSDAGGGRAHEYTWGREGASRWDNRKQ